MTHTPAKNTKPFKKFILPTPYASPKLTVNIVIHRWKNPSNKIDEVSKTMTS